jgi:hypothetical protein
MVEAIENIMRGMLDVEAGKKYTHDQLIAMLAVHINQLLQTNFEQLVNLLYRIDVSEKKLKQLLRDFPKEDAGTIIAALIVERQLEKINSRNRYKTDGSFDGEEKW